MFCVIRPSVVNSVPYTNSHVVMYIVTRSEYYYYTGDSII